MKDRTTEKRRVLSAAFVKSVTAEGRYGDERGSFGLHLRVHKQKNGRLAKSWYQQLRINGKVTNLAIGPAALLGLQAARERARANAQDTFEGGDPRRTVRKITPTAPSMHAESPTFREAVDAVIAMHSASWKHEKTEKRWKATLEKYAFPVLETKPVSAITSADVMAVLKPVWIAKPETGKKVKERIGMVMKWAIAEGYRVDNPAGDSIKMALPKRAQRTQHYKSLPFCETGAAIEQVQNTDAWAETKLCFAFIALTASRSGEARFATWQEIDMDVATWTVPAVRMKNGLEHRVPLSKQAIDVLTEAQAWGDGSGLVFPSPKGKAMSDNTLSKLARENDIGTTPHGLRSSFRTWAAECSDVPREIAEHALAHVEGSAAELAYRRTDYFEKRRALMQEWAEYLDRSASVEG